jgi:opine dehydrogenase
MKISVLGSGNGGCAVAADFALHGHDVSIFDFPEFTSNIDAIAKKNGIKATGEIKGFAPVSYAGYDLQKATQNADLIYVVVPSYAHKSMAEAYKKVMQEGQKIIICPGTNGGALVFKNTIRVAYSDNSIIVAETSTLPYACRIQNPGEVHVYLKLRDGLFIASLPSSANHEIFDPFSSVYPGASLYDNVFQTILQNGNNVIHPAISLLNVGRIESPDDFLFYEEGVTPAGGRLMKAVDEERMAIAGALGVTIKSEPETGMMQGYMTKNNYDTAYSEAPGFKGIVAQTQIDYRYFTEDVGYGLVLLTDLAKVVGVKTPVMDAIIQIVSVLLERDFLKEGQRTLESFGLQGLNKEELIREVS